MCKPEFLTAKGIAGFWKFSEERATRKLETHVDKSNGPDSCWPWKSKPSSEGYGALKIHGKRVLAHRFVYEKMVGPIPEGMTLDHLCRNRMCCNPKHLEPASNKVNVLRGEGPTAKNARKTHCPKGHSYAADTCKTIYNKSEKSWNRICMICKKENDRKRYLRRKEERRLSRTP